MENKKLQVLNQRLVEAYGVSVLFTERSLKDLKSYDAYNQSIIFKMITKQAQKGPQLKSDGGLGENCDSPLHHFAKIKFTAGNIRIIYRPVKKGDLVHMEVIAIGPRNDLEVYKLAEKRIQEFYERYGK